MTTQDSTKNHLKDEIEFLRELYVRIGIDPEDPENNRNTSEDSKNNHNRYIDNGAKAVLKRAMSGEPRHSYKTREFLPPIGEKSLWEEKHIWIPVACLSIFYPQSISKAKQRKNFGHSCWLLQQEIQHDSPDAKGVARRFRALLDTPLEDIQAPLASLVRQMKQKKFKKTVIDYPKLIEDLCRWEYPEKNIQDNWARAFWGASNIDEESPKSLVEDSESAFAKIWNNPEDAAYNDL
jgi:CRISPR system Cascade subunit CasB